MNNMSFFLISLLVANQVYANTPTIYPQRTAPIATLSVNNRPDFYVHSPSPQLIDIFNYGGGTDGVLGLNNTYFLPRFLEEGHKLDVWQEGPLSFPFVSLYCSTGMFNSGCSGTSTRVKPAHIDSNGFYGFQDPGSASNGLRSKITQTYFYHLRDLPVGASTSYKLNYCTYIDKNNSNRCTAQTGPVDWRVISLTHNKVGNMIFTSHDIDEEIVIDSSGNPVQAPGGSGICVADHQFNLDGFTCTIASYTLQWIGIPNSPFEDFWFGGVRLASDIWSSHVVGFKFGTLEWMKIDRKNTAVSSNRIGAQRGGQSIKIFLSNALIKAISQSNTLKLEHIAELWAVAHSSLYSGFKIPFTGDISVIPRAQSVSIKASDGSMAPFLEGDVGKDNLMFQYDLSESGYTSAARLEVKVTQDFGSPHQGLCTFYPTGQIEQENAVPIPTTLSFRAAGNVPISAPISCNGTPIELKAQNIMESRPAEEWDEGGKGYTRFYELGLNFLLRDNMVKKTVNGDDWEGTVHQSGKIILTGIWN